MKNLCNTGTFEEKNIICLQKEIIQYYKVIEIKKWKRLVKSKLAVDTQI